MNKHVTSKIATTKIAIMIIVVRLKSRFISCFSSDFPLTDEKKAGDQKSNMKMIDGLSSRVAIEDRETNGMDGEDNKYKLFLRLWTVVKTKKR